MCSLSIRMNFDSIINKLFSNEKVNKQVHVHRNTMCMHIDSLEFGIVLYKAGLCTCSHPHASYFEVAINSFRLLILNNITHTLKGHNIYNIVSFEEIDNIYNKLGCFMNCWLPKNLHTIAIYE